MLSQVVKAGLALVLAGTVLVLIFALDGARGAKPKRERAEDLVLLATSPDDPQRAIVLVRSSRLEAGELTLELELRNNSAALLTGQVWGQALLSSTRLVESTSRETFKARVKTFKTLRFTLPAAAKDRVDRLEVFVLDDATGVVTKYGEAAPKPAT